MTTRSARDRMGRALACVLRAELAACAVACGGVAGSAPDASNAVAPGDARAPGEEDIDALSPETWPIPADQDTDATVIPLADRDAAGCATTFNPRVVCFGAGSAPYEMYLVEDAGVGVGQCPAETAFVSARGEGSCGFTACGPLLPSAVGALVGDAGAEAGDGGDGQGCCFLVVQVCGV